MSGLFSIRGGAQLAGRKAMTTNEKIITCAIADILNIPLQQHVGTAAVPIVNVGERVLKGQLIAKSKGPVSAPIHAPTSGRVKRIGDHLAPHPSGLPILTLTLEPDGLDEWAELPPPLTLENATADQIATRVAEAGVVGMGGAAFPSAVKLNLGKIYKLDMLLMNGAECEPYLTCDDRLMQERSAKTVVGIRWMMKALNVNKAIIAIENNKQQSFAVMQRQCLDEAGIEVVYVPTRYPMGSSKHLVQAITGRETPASGRTADLGVVVNNMATAYAVYEAVCLGRPLISRIVTVSGHAVRRPANYDTLIGTSVKFLLHSSGGLKAVPKQLLIGGPMMGIPIPSQDVPITKGTSGVLALDGTEVKENTVMPCISCGSCVHVCPAGLLPLDMALLLRHEEIDRAAEIGLRDCISCGSCNYVCPSHIPLVQFFNYGKGRLKVQGEEKQQHEKIKMLTEKRTLRLEKQAQVALENERDTS